MNSLGEKSSQYLGKISEGEPVVYVGKLFQLEFRIPGHTGFATSWPGSLTDDKNKVIEIKAEIAEGPWLGFWLAMDVVFKEVLIVDPNSVRLIGRASATTGGEINGLTLDGKRKKLAPEVEREIENIAKLSLLINGFRRGEQGGV